MKLIAEYLHPGAFMSEESTKEVSDLEDAIAKAPTSAFCFTLKELPEVDFEYDKARFRVSAIPQNESGRYYLGGTIYTVDQIRARVEDGDPSVKVLLSNMQGNRWDKVIRCKTGNYQPFEEGDILV